MSTTMRYCPETVVVQSAFFLGEKLANLEDKTDKLFPAVNVVEKAIIEVTRGLSIHGDQEYQLLPIEKQALHCKLHFWLYKTWCKSINSGHPDDDDDDLDGFPTLPRFGTRMYVSIVHHMQWEQLLIECLLHSPSDSLLHQIQEITSTILEAPSTEDTVLFASMLDNLLDLDYSPVNTDCQSLNDTLINTLASLSQYIQDENTQITILKRIIEFVFQCCFGTQGSKIQPFVHELKVNDPFQNPLDSIHSIEKLTLKELQKLQENLEVDFSSVRQNEISKMVPSETQTIEKDALISNIVDCSKLLHILTVLMELFTQHWTAVTHWKTSPDSQPGQIDLSTWHPLHHWLLALYTSLQVVLKENIEDKNMNDFCGELGKYVDAFATTTERDWVSKGMEGSLIEWHCMDRSVEECFDVAGSRQTSMFSSESTEETLSTAAWRVNENLEGSEDCFNWLLTTEELFDNPTWLDCIQTNAICYAGKDQVIMMVDILCVQRQMIESMPESSGDFFTAITKVLVGIFKELPPLDQQDIIKYNFSMSIISGLDIQNNSMFFIPNCEESKKELQEHLQAVLNKLVDSSQAAALREVKVMVLMSPFLVLRKVLSEVVKYRHSNKAIYKILQEIPVLSSLSSSDSSPKLLCQILSSLMVSVNTKQEEKNLINLFQQLLKPYKKDNSPVPSQSLMNITELVQTCVIPYLTLQDNTLTLTLTLKVLKASLSTLNTKEQKNKIFILKYLIPIVLTLMKHLNACKVSWEGMGPCVSIPLSLAEVGILRGHIIDVLGVSTGIIVRCFQGLTKEITGPVEWLIKKAGELDWTTALYLRQLQGILLSKHVCHVPSCLTEICDLQAENWKTFKLENNDVVHNLFEICVVSDSILTEVVSKLKHNSRMAGGLVDEVVKSLCKFMAYLSPAEISRLVVLCKELLQNCTTDHRDQECQVDIPISISKSINDDPSLRTTLLLSSVLHQVFQAVSQPCCSSWATPEIMANMVKHYVNIIKSLCQELTTDVRHEKFQTGDVIAYIFADICHVICLVPNDVTDPLFILALDVATHVGRRHVDVLRDFVAMVPTSVYTESLTQKLSA